MSLDVYLTGPVEIRSCRCPNCDNDHTFEEKPEYFSTNITHNLNKMAEEAGIYNHLWRPEEIGITKAGQLIPALRAGLALLIAEPERFKKFDASNGWGTYRDFVPWVREYLNACEKYPDADINVSR